MSSGTYEHTMDAKNRIIIPQKLREELGSVLHACKGFDHCIYIFETEGWEKFRSKLEGLSMTNPKARKVKRIFLGSAKELEMDKQGRIVLDPTLRKHADITKDIVIVGMGDYLEVWDRDTYYDMNGDDDMDELVAEAGIEF